MDQGVWQSHFIYCNNITNTITDFTRASSALYSDAVAQAVAEQTAWPYSWFTNTNYAGASTRGAVSGTIIINDTYNPNASPAGLWVGVVQQPSTTSATYDFQKWMKPYQFWVKTDSNGDFTIPNAIAGTNYTLYAFGPGVAGTFMSQNQTGGNPPTWIIFHPPISVSQSPAARPTTSAASLGPRPVSVRRCLKSATRTAKATSSAMATTTGWA